MATGGYSGILFTRRAASPRWIRMAQRVKRWATVWPSSSPVCLARAAAIFLISLVAMSWRPPRDSATTGMKANPSWFYLSEFNLALSHDIILALKKFNSVPNTLICYINDYKSKVVSEIFSVFVKIRYLGMWVRSDMLKSLCQKLGGQCEPLLAQSKVKLLSKFELSFHGYWILGLVEFGAKG